MAKATIIQTFHMGGISIELSKRPKSNIIGKGGYSVQVNSDNAIPAITKSVGTAQLNYAWESIAMASYDVEVAKAKLALIVIPYSERGIYDKDNTPSIL